MNFMHLVCRKKFIQVTKCFKFVKNYSNKLHTFMFSVIVYAYYTYTYILYVTLYIYIIHIHIYTDIKRYKNVQLY